MSSHCLVSVCLLAGATWLTTPALAQNFPAAAYQDLQWRMVGPMRGGRTRAVAGVAQRPYEFYVGAVNGGVWKTDDAGNTWHPLFDDQPTQSIGAIEVAPSDPNIVYVGSGEGLVRPDLSVGDGIYRSADGGRSWEHLGLRDGQQIPALAVDPRDPNHLYAAVLGHPFGPSEERGIYRSRDGGRNWERVLYKDANTGGSAIALDPLHPDVVYAGLWETRAGPWEDKNVYDGRGGGLYKSTDGGTHWRHITAGLPENLSQLNLAIAPSSPNRVYLIAGTTEPGEYSSAAGLGLYRSDDGGEHWSRVTDDPRPALRIGGGDLPILRVDPKNPDTLYSVSLVTVKSVDGGKTWKAIRGAPGGDDYQNLWINPQNPDIIALVADQGAIVTLNGGRSWSSWYNQPTAQLYHIGITPTFPYKVCSGQQESGSVCIASRGNDGQITARDWRPVGAIEYGYVAPDPLNADIIYGGGRTQVSKFHVSTGQVQDVTPLPVKGASDRADRTEPLMFSPLDPHTLYYATNRLYQTRDGGEQWQIISPDLSRPSTSVPASVGKLHEPGAEHQRGVIYALAPSPLEKGVIWAGTDDGLLWRTHNGGAQWLPVSPPELGEWSKVTQIEASHFDVNTAYCSVSRFRIDDTRPYIYRTRDGGKSWQSIVAGLPADAAVNAVREDPARRGLLYAATEKAVWVSFDDGDHWESLQTNLPHTSMRDLAVQGTDLIVATHGRGFWILDDISRLRQLNSGMLGEPVLFKPRVAHRVQRSTWSDSPIPPDEPTAANPPDGAVIEYYLPKDARGVVKLEVLDSIGTVVRRYAGDDPLEPSAEELERQLIPTYWVAEPRQLSGSAGAHRWVWDLRHAPPLTLVHGYPISAVPHATPRNPLGPVAVPGHYAVRLTVDGRTLEAPLMVAPDPRVQAAPQAYEALYGLASRLSAQLSTASATLLRLRSIDAQLKALPASRAANPRIKSFKAKMVTLLGPADPDKRGSARYLPQVQSDLAGLYVAVQSADAAPTAAQVRACDSAGSALDALMARWSAVERELPPVNAMLQAAGVTAIRPELPPPEDGNVADEE